MNCRMRKLYFFTLFFICACVPKGLVHVTYGTEDLHVPRAYSFRPGTIGAESMFLQTFYPGLHVLLESWDELKQKDEHWKIIRMLVLYHPKSEISMHDLTVKMTEEHLKTTEIVGEEYGLIHKKQPESEIQDFDDAWLEKENGKYVSYINCSEKLNEISVPQCTHHFRINQKVAIQVSYDKRLLPEWKTIETNVLTLYDSFKSPDTALAFLRQSIKSQKDARRE